MNENINENNIIQTAIGIAIQMVGIPVVVNITINGITHTVVIDR